MTPRPADDETQATAWPWPDLSIESFPGDENARLGSLTPEQVAQVTTIPNGGQVLIAIAGPDGEPLSLSVRPTLPDTVVAA